MQGQKGVRAGAKAGVSSERACVRGCESTRGARGVIAQGCKGRCEGRCKDARGVRVGARGARAGARVKG